MSVSWTARGNIGSLNIDVPEPRGLANGGLTKPKQSHVLNSYHFQPPTVGAAANRWQTSFKTIEPYKHESIFWIILIHDFIMYGVFWIWWIAYEGCELVNMETITSSKRRSHPICFNQIMIQEDFDESIIKKKLKIISNIL